MGVSRAYTGRRVNRHRQFAELGLSDHSCIRTLRREKKWSTCRIAVALAAAGITNLRPHHRPAVGPPQLESPQVPRPDRSRQPPAPGTIVARHPGHLGVRRHQEDGRIPRRRRLAHTRSWQRERQDRRSGREAWYRTGYVYLPRSSTAFPNSPTPKPSRHEGYHRSRFHQPRQDVLRRQHHRQTHPSGHRQRLLLSLGGVRSYPRRHTPSVHPAVHPTTEWEGGALQSDPGQGVRLRSRLDQRNPTVTALTVWNIRYNCHRPTLPQRTDSTPASPTSWLPHN